MKFLLVLAILLGGCAATPKAPKVISVIGLGVCDKWMGGIAVTSDGQLHPSGDMTEDQALALSKGLPKGATTVAMGPCVKSIGT